MKLKTLLLEYNDKVATYSNELGAYIKILKPKINKNFKINFCQIN